MIRKPQHLYKLLKVKEEEVGSILNKIDSYYYTKVESKLDKNGNPIIKNGKEVSRVLTPSKGKLKHIQSLIKGRILRSFDFPEFIQGGVRGKDNISNAKRHKGMKYHFVSDIKDFFPFVTNKMIYNMFVQNGFSPDVSSLLTKLTTFDGHLPQGTPTSTYLANLVALPLDYSIIEYCNNMNIIYTRFVDDLSFSSSYDFKQNIPDIKSIVKSFGFHMHSSNKKTHYKVGPIIITGVRTKNNCLRAPKEKLTKLERENLSPLSRKGLLNYINRIKYS